MKKLLLAILFITVLLVAGIYIFIPRKIIVSETLKFACTINGANRFITDSAAWNAWWSDTSSPGENTFVLNGFSFTPGKKGFNSIQVLIGKENIAADTRITLLPVKRDSVFLEWRGVTESGNNPFDRIKAYNQRDDINNGMKMVLAQLRSYLEKNENIYGSGISRVKIKDTLLIATQVFTADTPSTVDIYKMINRLREHASKGGAQEIGPPMLHTRPEGKLLETMVALPINKEVNETVAIFKRRLLPGGNLLVTEVTGGPATIRRAYRELENYLSDYRLESPAKPFQSLITDRLAEPDTTKWITKIYCPVF